MHRHPSVCAGSQKIQNGFYGISQQMYKIMAIQNSLTFAWYFIFKARTVWRSLWWICQLRVNNNFKHHKILFPCNFEVRVWAHSISGEFTAAKWTCGHGERAHTLSLRIAVRKSFLTHSPTYSDALNKHIPSFIFKAHINLREAESKWWEMGVFGRKTVGKCYK